MIRKYIIIADDSLKGFDEGIEDLERKWGAEEIEPCDDAISREEVLAEILKKPAWHNSDGSYYHADDIRDAVKNMPSVTPQPKMGRWLEKEVNSDKVIEEWQSARCSVCDRYHTTPYMYYFSHYEYCPHCGSKMEVSDAK